jgi:hypothetical protein
MIRHNSLDTLWVVEQEAAAERGAGIRGLSMGESVVYITRKAM